MIYLIVFLRAPFHACRLTLDPREIMTFLMAKISSGWVRPRAGAEKVMACEPRKILGKFLENSGFWICRSAECRTAEVCCRHRHSSKIQVRRNIPKWWWQWRGISLLLFKAHLLLSCGRCLRRAIKKVLWWHSLLLHTAYPGFICRKTMRPASLQNQQQG